MLRAYGWDDAWEQLFAEQGEPGWVPARVIEDGMHVYRIATEIGELLAEVAGKFRHAALGRADFPAVGDWVAVQYANTVDRAVIHALLPRRTCFVRKLAGREIDSQVLAANVDFVWLVMAANDVNVRRLERYLIAAWESGARPVVVLSKADLVANVTDVVQEVQQACLDVPVHVISAETGAGMAALLSYCGEGLTVSLLGASGAGKSTVVNYVLDEPAQAVQAVRSGDQRGRHTTTQRSLFKVPAGGVIMDTPGMRELQLWHQDVGMESAFPDIERWSEQCAFRDCQHHSEPGCAVRRALDDGTLDAGRFDNYQKLQRELSYLARKDDKAARAAERDKWQKLSKARRHNRVR